MLALVDVTRRCFGQSLVDSPGSESVTLRTFFHISPVPENIKGERQMKTQEQIFSSEKGKKFWFLGVVKGAFDDTEG